MAKKHFWISNQAMKRLTGIVGTCLDCGESRTDNLRGGTCPGTKTPKAIPSIKPPKAAT